MSSDARSDGAVVRPAITTGTTGLASSLVGAPPGPPTVVECVHAAECAGCPLIHLDYPQQLATKRGRVVTAVTHYPTLELLYTRPLESAEPFVGYRGRAKLIVSSKGRVGLYARTGNHEVVDIPDCQVLTPALGEVAAALRRLLADPPLAARPLLLPYDPMPGGAGGLLRAIDLREVQAPPSSSPRGPAAPPAVAVDAGTGEIPIRVGVLLTLVLQRDRAPAREDLIAAARVLRPLLPRVTGIAANFHEGDAPQILGPDTLLLDGVARAEDAIGPTFHVATFGSFVQAHRSQAARVHTAILSEVATIGGGHPRVLDLYGGSGAISLALAKAGCQVTLVESFGPAATNARVAAEAQGLSIDVRTGDAADAASNLATTGATFDAVVMNPPRRGVSPAAREAIAKLGAALCIYVSCDPDTLARDLDHFTRLGYTATELTPFDMIPLTEEVETVCVLRRSQPTVPRILYEDQDVIIVDKGPHEPIGRDERSYGSSLLRRMTRIPSVGDARLEPVFDLDAGTSGLAVLARSEAVRAAWAAALASSGRLVYLAAAKSITPAKGAITRDLQEGGRAYPARTRYRRLAIASGHSILRVIPDGGRIHQIRRHLAAIGHPVIGDERYGHLPTNRYFEEKHGLDRSFVHLVRIEIVHPRTGARLLVESPLPGDLRAALERATGGTVLRFLEQKHALGDQRSSSIPPPSLDDPPLSEAPPSSSISSFPSSIPSSIPPEDLVADSRRGPTLTLPPDVDESPRTIRHVIISDDED